MIEMSSLMLKTLYFCTLFALLGCTQSRELDNACQYNSEAMLPSRMYSVGGDSLQVTAIYEYSGQALEGVGVLGGHEYNNSGVTAENGTVKLRHAPGDTLQLRFIGRHTEWVRLPAGYDSLIVIMRDCAWSTPDDHVS